MQPTLLLVPPMQLRTLQLVPLTLLRTLLLQVQTLPPTPQLAQPTLLLVPPTLLPRLPATQLKPLPAQLRRRPHRRTKRSGDIGCLNSLSTAAHFMRGGFHIIGLLPPSAYAKGFPCFL